MPHTSPFSRRQAAVAPQADQSAATSAQTVGSVLGGVVGALAAGIPSGGVAAPAGLLHGSQLGSSLGAMAGADEPGARQRAARDLMGQGLSAFSTYRKLSGGGA